MSDDKTVATPPGLIPTCRHCMFAVQVNEYGMHCRRFPPKVFGQVALDGSGNDYWDNLNPFVGFDHWCGEGRREP